MLGMIRCAFLVLIAFGLAAGEAAPTGHTFTANELRIYVFEHEQSATWNSADDEIAITSKLFWRFTLVPTTVEAERTVLTVTFTRLKADMDAPGSEHSFDSRNKQDADDPLFGYLRLLHGRSFELTVDPATGAVAEVTGGEAVVEAMNELQEARTGDVNPYLEAQTRAMVAPERLRLIWSRILEVPGTGPEALPLAADLEIAPVRTWDGADWTLALPEDADPPLIEIATEPTPATIRLVELAGEGRTVLTDGILKRTGGTMTWTTSGTALTQRFEQRHRAEWICRLFDPTATDGP